MPVGKIETTGTTEDPVSTPHSSGESVQEWVERHDDKLDDKTPSGNTLTTKWPYETSGTEKEVDTERRPNEPDSTFMDRHKADYGDEMISCPPVTTTLS